MFTGIQRKRKSDICQCLRKKFKPFAKSDSFKDYLFDEKAVKKMNQDLKTIHDKSRNGNFYQCSKLGLLLQDPEEPESQGQK